MPDDPTDELECVDALPNHPLSNAAIKTLINSDGFDWAFPSYKLNSDVTIDGTTFEEGIIAFVSLRRPGELDAVFVFDPYEKTWLMDQTMIVDTEGDMTREEVKDQPTPYTALETASEGLNALNFIFEQYENDMFDSVSPKDSPQMITPEQMFNTITTMFPGEPVLFAELDDICDKTGLTDIIPLLGLKGTEEAIGVFIVSSYPQKSTRYAALSFYDRENKEWVVTSCYEIEQWTNNKTKVEAWDHGLNMVIKPQYEKDEIRSLNPQRFQDVDAI